MKSKMHIVCLGPMTDDQGRYTGWKKAINWCGENIQGLWYYVGEGVFEFDNEQEYLMFVVRWR